LSLPERISVEADKQDMTDSCFSRSLPTRQLLPIYIHSFCVTCVKTSIRWSVRLSWLQKCPFTPTFFGWRFWPVQYVGL